MAIHSNRSLEPGMPASAAGDAAHVIPTLEGFRNKLLDLTTRNKLLNLGLKSQRTASLLRFVDCNLQTVLDGLASGRQLALQHFFATAHAAYRRSFGPATQH